MTKTGNRSHLIHYLGTQELICQHCGIKWSINSVLPNSLWVLPACMEAFMMFHEDCEISEEGIEVKKWMQEDWETNWKHKKENP
jgi:hypothetical protein